MDPVHPDIYTYQRTVRYSDCDASRNYFTPRVMDYAVEAVEGWFENVLGVSRTELISLREIDVDFVHAECEFSKTVTAGEAVKGWVKIVHVDNSKIMFNVSGNNDAGELCFLVNLTVRLVKHKRSESIQIPLEYRKLIENYQAHCVTDDVNVKDTNPNMSIEHCMSFPLTSNSCDVPFVFKRRVVFGECDMSGSIYAPRVFEYLLEAVGEWYEKFLGISWLEQNSRKIGQPFLKISCDYLNAMVPGQMIYTMITVTKLGRSSIAYSAVGFKENGTQCFNAQLTACYSFEIDGFLKATPFPEVMRGRITAYQMDCDKSKS